MGILPRSWPLVLVVALASALALHSDADEHARASSTTISLGTTTSTGIYLGSTEYTCEHRVILLDSGPYESLEMLFEGRGVLGFNQYGCSALLGSSATTDEGRVTSQVADHWVQISGLNGLTAPDAFLDCGSWDYWERGDPIPEPVDFADFRVWAVAATGVGVKLPRVCVTGIACEDVRDNLEWSGEPICGDADYDFRRSAVDALIALGASTATAACTPDPFSCDIDDDGVVTASDALGILQLGVGLSVPLDCRPPCLPGTVGPPGQDRVFEIELSLLLPLEAGRDFWLVVDYSAAGGVIPWAGQYSDCEPQGFFGIAEFQDIQEDALTAFIAAPGQPSSARDVILTCRFQAEGDAAPDPAKFEIRTTDHATDEPIEGLVGITRVRIPPGQYPHY